MQCMRRRWEAVNWAIGVGDGLMIGREKNAEREKEKDGKRERWTS